MIGTPGGSAERPAVFFTGPEEFRAWLEANHDTATELWMGLRKKHVADRGLTWEQAVPEALCFGWIDSVSQRIDDDTRRQRWTPRRPGSNWSRINVALVERLVAEGRMRPAGLAAYERRTPDRTAIYAYEGGRDEPLPPEVQVAFDARPVAAAFWALTTPSYRRTVVSWLASAKRDQTRASRIETLVDDCEHGRLIRSQQYGVEPAWARKARIELGLPEPARPTPRSP